MTKKEVLLFHSYYLNNLQSLEEDLYNAQSRIRWRKIDITDTVELICAQQRLETYKEFMGHLRILLNIDKQLKNGGDL